MLNVQKGNNILCEHKYFLNKFVNNLTGGKILALNMTTVLFCLDSRGLIGVSKNSAYLNCYPPSRVLWPPGPSARTVYG